MIPDDVAAYRPIVGCAISDDGQWCAVAVPSHDVEQDDRPLQVYLRSLEAGAPWRPISTGDGARRLGPSFAPGSRRVGMVRVLAGQRHVEVVDLTSDKFEGLLLPGTPALPQAVKWTGSPGQPTCVGDDEAGWRRVWVWSELGEPPKACTPAGVHVGDYAFRPDASALAWVRIPDPGDPVEARLPIALADGGGEGTREVPVPGRPVGYLSWSPDGRWLSYMARRAGQRLSPARLWVVDPFRWPGEPDAARCLTRELEGTLTGYDWEKDGAAVIVSVIEGTLGRLYRVTLDGVVTPVGPVDRYASGPHGDRSQGRLLYLEQHGDHPQRLQLLSADEEEPRQITWFHEPLAAGGLRPSRTVTWTATDGLGVEGIVVRAHEDRPSPLLVWLHGGPAECVAHTFSPYFQVFAEAGWTVFAPNYRGSTGRGEDILRANVGDLGGRDTDDVLTGIDRLVQMGWADTEGTALVGWSYGGTLALHLAAKSAIPRALVVGAPVVDWVAFFGAPRAPLVYGDYFPAPCWEDRTPYDAASPMTHVRHIEVPTLILHGSQDQTVPVSQSRLLYRALKARGVDTDLMVYPGEGHVLSRPSAVSDMLERILEWCAR